MDKQELQRLKSNGQLNNAIVAVLTTAGLVCGAFAFSGRQTDLVEYCFRPQKLTNRRNARNYCNAHQRYIMPEPEFNAWERQPMNPLYQDGWTLPAKATRLRTIPANNPEKYLWGLAGAGCFGVALLLSKGREGRLLHELPGYREEVKTSWFHALIAESLKRRKVEYAAEIDYQLYQFAATRTARERQLAMLTPEELAVYQEKVRLQSSIESASLLQQATGTPAAALPGQSMADIANPGDKVQSAEACERLHEVKDRQVFDPWQADLNNLTPEYRYLREFISNTALILGSQGSGKSWFVRLLALLKKLKGYRVIVFDPNSNQGEWQGVEFYGSYSDIAHMMRWYVDEIQARYDAFRQSNMSEAQWRTQLWQRGKAMTVLCEEYTTYSDFIEDEELLRKFVKSANTLSRKQEAPVTFVAHNLTKDCLGGVPGVFDIFKRMQRVQLDTTTDPNSDQPVAAGTGRVKGVDSDGERQIIAPKLSIKITDFRTETERLQATREQLALYDLLEDITPQEPPEKTFPDSETLECSHDHEILEEPKQDIKRAKQPQHKSDSTTEGENQRFVSPQRYTRFQLTYESAQAEIQRLRNAKRNQTDIILFLWDAKPGDNEAYRNAISEYKKLLTVKDKEIEE
ncbi:MAG: DUF87 domain-containing protein [Mojavia pulchra JT2-VF2]|jgi:energy-coupling factor transporter ATP-binding protein EcfA2|uniref:DUF87 domain-containing protein n=1 Tax=Mojavia pulchra JT2-VF2 TaxID=287848 RepID=A0A951Q5X6_9NOST|nr:DUF87 domain-containing protein [Mojavia pulchra JT2-VF2]